MKLILISFFLFLEFNVNAQNCFTYDAAGNRIKRISSCVISLREDDKEIFYSLLDSNSLKKDNDLSELIIYPNPSSGLFKLRNQDDYVGDKLTILSLEGKLIESLVVDLSDFDFMHLSSGQYIIILTSKDSRRTAKLIIIK